jgi:alkylation response protein AidB-like acyl-CoA dehydrogenase
MLQVVLAEEMARAEAPGPVNPIGLSNIAPAIMAFGSDEQKRRHLPRMLRGDDIWCQGFSEPGAGSDLASLRTRAVGDGDTLVVSGQKVWNTLGEFADWCELLVRTDPDAPRHAGISCLLVDMSLPGIEVRPLTTITGGREFSEIFFDSVRVPRSALLGPLNEGWRVAMATLSFERAGVALLHLGVRRKIARLIREARALARDGRALADDPVVRQKLARAYLMGEYQMHLAQVAVSRQHRGLPPGAEGSLSKLVWSAVEEITCQAAAAVHGQTVNAGAWGEERLWVRSTSIAGGTTEVNKNIVARRILGLPRAG